MMNRLHCTKVQLDEMEAGEYAIFLAFARGESEGIRAKAASEAAARAMQSQRRG